MEQKKEIKTVNDVVTRASDFVITHETTEVFPNYYLLDHQVIGEGAFGRVQKCKHKETGNVFAVKIINQLEMSQVEKVRLQYEIDILKNLNHPNIVRLYEVFQDKKQILLVTELCEGRELFDEIIDRKTFTEAEAAIVTKQILQAISYCHEQKVAHRDLKPENILINPKEMGSIKVIDFGTSHVFDKEQHEMHQMYGTAYYIAPEVLEGKYTESCDLWSIGVILYIMLSGRPPFSGKNDRDILKAVQEGNYSLRGDLWDRRSEMVKSLIRGLMNMDAERRLTAKKALEHAWFKKQDEKNTFDVEVAQEAIKNLRGFRVMTLQSC